MIDSDVFISIIAEKDGLIEAIRAQAALDYHFPDCTEAQYGGVAVGDNGDEHPFVGGGEWLEYCNIGHKQSLELAQSARRGRKARGEKR